MVNFKIAILFIRMLTCFIWYRTFGNVLYNIVEKYSEMSSLWKNIAKRYQNCKVFNVMPQFLVFNSPNTNDSDSRFIRKWLLRSALKKRKYERYELEEELRKISIGVYGLLSSLDWYIIRALIKNNVDSMVKTTVRTHEKKLKELMLGILMLCYLLLQRKQH